MPEENEIRQREPDHLAPGRSTMARPDPRTCGGRPAANTPLAEDRHIAHGQIEDKAAESNLPHAE